MRTSGVCILLFAGLIAAPAVADQGYCVAFDNYTNKAVVSPSFKTRTGSSASTVSLNKAEDAWFAWIGENYSSRIDRHQVDCRNYPTAAANEKERRYFLDGKSALYPAAHSVTWVPEVALLP